MIDLDAIRKRNLALRNEALSWCGPELYCDGGCVDTRVARPLLFAVADDIDALFAEIDILRKEIKICQIQPHSYHCES